MGRALHLIDIENLIGGSQNADPAICCVAFEAYREVSGYEPGDLVIVAAGVTTASCAFFHWEGVCRRTARGENGADLVLLGALATEPRLERFDRIVIASGDGIFASAASGLAARGIHVEAVSRRGSMSRRLRSAVAAVHELDLGARLRLLA
jgi:hypothetical protein